MSHLPNDFGWSDLSRRREFEQRHQGAPIEPMDYATRGLGFAPLVVIWIGCVIVGGGWLLGWLR